MTPMTPNARRTLMVALLSLGCSARTVNGGSTPTDDTPMTSDAAPDNGSTTPDVTVTPDATVAPDAMVSPDVTVAPDVMVTPDVPVTPDVTVTPDAMVVGGCYVEEGASSLCPAGRVMNSPTQPSFRITHLGITSPVALASPILLNVLNGATHSGALLWGVNFDLSARTFQTGALTVSPRGTVGQGLFDGEFHYATMARGALMSSGDQVTTTTAMGTVVVPVFDSSGARLTNLPLDNVRFTVTLAPDRGCIGLGRPSGGRFNECTSAWDTASGRIDAAITVANARMVTVTALMTTLCNLIAGANCDATPESMWPRQPDTTVNGMPAYTLSSGFAAVAATVR